MKKYLSNPLVLISLAAIVSAIGLAVGAAVPLLRLVLALLLVLVLPGWAFSAALFVHPSPASIERVLIVIGSSILIAILTGVLLNLTPWGLNALSWTASLGGFTLASCLVAGLRQNRAGIFLIPIREP